MVVETFSIFRIERRARKLSVNVLSNLNATCTNSHDVASAFIIMDNTFLYHPFKLVVGYSDESDISTQACHCLMTILKSTNNCHSVVIIQR